MPRRTDPVLRPGTCTMAYTRTGIGVISEIALVTGAAVVVPSAAAC